MTARRMPLANIILATDSASTSQFPWSNNINNFKSDFLAATIPV